jgi:hypothetical protein
MSEFLVVIPEGWIQLDWEIVSNLHNLSEQSIRNGIISDIEQALRDHSLIPEDKVLMDYKLLDNTYFMIKLG